MLCVITGDSVAANKYHNTLSELACCSPSYFPSCDTSIPLKTSFRGGTILHSFCIELTVSQGSWGTILCFRFCYSRLGRVYHEALPLLLPSLQPGAGCGVGTGWRWTQCQPSCPSHIFSWSFAKSKKEDMNSMISNIYLSRKTVTNYYNFLHSDIINSLICIIIQINVLWKFVKFHNLLILYYGVVYGSPCGRPEKVCWFILPWLALRRTGFSSEKNCCYSFLSSSKKNLNDSTFPYSLSNFHPNFTILFFFFSSLFIEINFDLDWI